MGFALLASLSLLSALAALAVAVRGWRGSRAEVLVVTATLWTGLIGGAALALGWAGMLTAPALAGSVAACSVALLVAGIAGPRPQRRLADTAVALREILALPVTALREAWAERSIAVLGLLLTYGVVLWTAWLSWLAPSGAWDSIWYHDTIVGLAIQNRGFEWVDAPRNLEFVNSYPKTSEMLSLWFVIFTDRRLIEIPNSLYAPVLVVAFFLVARRYAGSRVGAMGWGTVLLLLPAIVLELRSTYVDLLFVTMFTVAACFVTRPVLRVRDILLASLAIGLLGGMKGTGMVLAPLLAGLLVLRAAALAWQRRSGWPAAAWLAGTCLAVAMAAPFYVRNWQRHDNPAWPLRIDNELLGIHWPGHWQVSSQRGADEVLEELFSPPRKDQQFHDSRDNGYGNGPPFLILPLALVALLWAPASLARSAFARAPPERRVDNLLFLVLPTLGATLLSPAWWWARFNLHGVVAAFLLAFWLLGRPRLQPLLEGILGALVVTSAMTLWWSEPRWEVDWDTAWELAAMTPEERAVQQTAWGLPAPEVMVARERDLGRGDVVAFTESFGFPATLWNEKMSNRLAYVPFGSGASAFLDRLEEVAAEWAVVERGSRHERALRSLPQSWELVGPTTNKNLAYRRTSMPLVR